MELRNLEALETEASSRWNELGEHSSGAYGRSLALAGMSLVSIHQGHMIDSTDHLDPSYPETRWSLEPRSLGSESGPWIPGAWSPGALHHRHPNVGGPR